MERWTEAKKNAAIAWLDGEAISRPGPIEWYLMQVAEAIFQVPARFWGKNVSEITVEHFRRPLPKDAPKPVAAMTVEEVSEQAKKELLAAFKGNRRGDRT
jgi:hypothetical protein